MYVYTGECGFLNENRRTNVAVTRARRHLTLIGDSGTIMHEPFIREMVNYCHEFGEVWTAREYLSGKYISNRVMV